MINRTFALGLTSSFVLLACGVVDGEQHLEVDGSPESVASVTQSLYAGPSSLTLSAAGCQISALFTRPPTPSGWTALRHELERKRANGTTWAVVSSNAGSSSGVSDLYPLLNTQYAYRVKTVFGKANGQIAVSAPSAEATATAPCSPPPKATSGTTSTVNVYLFTPRNATVPYNQAYVQKLMFDTSDPQSAFNYLKEVSAGALHTQFIPQVRIGGQVLDWRNLAKTASEYSAGHSAMWQEILNNGTVNTLTTQNPASYHIFVFNSGAAGGDSGGNWIQVGANALLSSFPAGTMVHELGHSFGAQHEAFLYCPQGVPALTAKIPGVCTISKYGSATNVMSNSHNGNHYSGFHKRKLGFLSAQTVTSIDARSIASGQSIQTHIYPSTTTQSASSKQLIFLQLDDTENSYVLQYRTAKGRDQTTAFGSSTVPFPEGVFVYLRPGHSWGSGMTDSDIFLLHRTNFGADPVILTPSSQPYTDTARNLEIRVSAANNLGATVVIKKL